MLCTPNRTQDPCAQANSRIGATDQVNSVVQRALAGTQQVRHAGERRREHRTPYPYLMKLSPVAADGETPVGEGFVVVGKHLSLGGVDFYHREPLPYRWAIMWLETGAPTSQPVLVELLWCRFNKQGWYENGGRFVRLLSEGDTPSEFHK